jgi:aminomethyltransferase
MASVSPHNELVLSDPEAWPAHFGSVKDEYRALRSTCGLYRLLWRRKIKLTGSDRVRWLNGMVTNNIRDLAVGHGVYAFLLNPQGHILGDLLAYNEGEFLLVDTDASQLDKILATFDHYIIMDDVEVTNVSEQLTAIGLTGPDSAGVINNAGFTLPEMKPLQIVDLRWHEVALSVIRGESEIYPSYEIWLAPKDANKVREALQNAGAVAVGTEALELYRIAQGIPRYGQDIRERDLPQETEQQRALNFNKGCYVGQEIVERIRSRGNVHRKFTGFTVSGPPPAPGTKIHLQEKEVGEITSSASIPAPGRDQIVALGYVRREFAIRGKEVVIGSSPGLVSDLPFADLLSR